MALTEGAKRVRRKRATRPVYLMVRRLKDPITGEDVGALVPANEIDARLLRDRKFKVGKEIRAELKQPRNPAFHRLVHAVGVLMVDNVESFAELGSHDAVKRLQRECGVCCDQVELDLGTLGKVMVNHARSIAFDELEEDEFRALFDGLVAHISANYAHVMLDDVRGTFWELVNGERR